MKKISKLSKVSLLLAVLFGIDKILGVARQMIISRQFGLSAELDVFNAANNLPDMLFMLISGGALAIAFIPVLTEALTKEGRGKAWDLFFEHPQHRLPFDGCCNDYHRDLCPTACDQPTGYRAGFHGSANG